jgi:hypothetical protein
MQRLLFALAMITLASQANAKIVGRDCGELPQVNTVHSTDSP